MSDLPSWLIGILGLLAGILGTANTDKRLETYPQLVKAAARLAVYFPTGDPPVASIGRQECRDSCIVSSRPQDSSVPQDAEDISVEKLDKYRAELARELDLNDVEN